jgi:hypothetical protein
MLHNKLYQLFSCYIVKGVCYLLTYLLHGTTVLVELWLPHIFLSVLSSQLFLTSIF